MGESRTHGEVEPGVLWWEAWGEEGYSPETLISKKKSVISKFISTAFANRVDR